MSTLWGCLWRSENKLDGRTEHLIYDGMCLPVLFRKRREAREYIKQKYGYIRTREDLREEPHGWMMPIVVKVKIERVSK